MRQIFDEVQKILKCGWFDIPLRSTFEIGIQIILLKIDGFLKGWILNITPLKVLSFLKIRSPVKPIWPDSSKKQAMSCEGACAHAHVRCAVARVRVPAKSILQSVRDVCATF